MYKFLILLGLIVSTSCGGDDNSGGGSSTPPAPTEVEVTLEELDPENPPTESTWVVTNDDITTSEDLDTLKEALTTAAASDQEVEVVLSSIETMPDNSFTDCVELTSISLPAVTTVGASAFEGCTSLTTISVPAAEVISESAFSGCEELTTISLPAVTTVGVSAFEGCTSLTTVEVPVAEEIADNAFSGCGAIEEIALPVATTIGSGAFASCSNLTSLSLATDTKLQSIAADAFSTAPVAAITRSTEISITITITLSISYLNWEYIDGNTLTIGDFSEEFKEIIIVGLTDMTSPSPDINDWDKIELQ